MILSKSREIVIWCFDCNKQITFREYHQKKHKVKDMVRVTTVTLEGARFKA